MYVPNDREINFLKFCLAALFSGSVLLLCLYKLAFTPLKGDERTLYWGGLLATAGIWTPSPIGTQRPGVSIDSETTNVLPESSNK